MDLRMVGAFKGWLKVSQLMGLVEIINGVGEKVSGE